MSNFELIMRYQNNRHDVFRIHWSTTKMSIVNINIIWHQKLSRCGVVLWQTSFRYWWTIVNVNVFDTWLVSKTQTLALVTQFANIEQINVYFVLLGDRSLLLFSIFGSAWDVCVHNLCSAILPCIYHKLCCYSIASLVTIDYFFSRTVWPHCITTTQNRYSEPTRLYLE